MGANNVLTESFDRNVLTEFWAVFFLGSVLGVGGGAGWLGAKPGWDEQAGLGWGWALGRGGLVTAGWAGAGLGWAGHRNWVPITF